ncbi:MAG: hypothetical protein K5784_11810 [Clostridiales bacterium]|nr:hypothetical protein [Clostridiales bacterium]
MYSKALCEWFLTDGIYPPVRLDAPEYIEDALTEAGVLGVGLDVEERCRNEWIYRRTWRYLTQFTLPDTEKRVFMRLSGLKGRWRVTVNGALAAEGTDSWCETEITGLLGVPNYLEIAFLPDDSFSLFPQAGFKGSFLLKQAGKGVIKDFRCVFSAEGEPGFMCAADTTAPGRAKLAFTLSNSRGEFTETLDQALPAGYTPLKTGIFAGKLAAGETNRLSARLNFDGETCDAREAEIYIPAAKALLRGAVCLSEEDFELARELHADTAYTRDAEADDAFIRRAAKYGLFAAEADEDVKQELPSAMCNPDEVDRICPDGRALEDDVIWKLTQSDRACFDEAGGSSEELEEAAALSRYNQALALKNLALDARLAGKSLVLDGMVSSEYSLSSPALVDLDGLKRPAFFALKDAWQKEYAFCRLPENLPDEGIFTVKAYYAADDPAPKPRAVSVSAYDLSGREIFSTTFAATVSGCVGSFALEMPEGGVALIRTRLFDGGQELSVSDLAAFMSGRGIEDLGEARLFCDGESLVNDSDTLAVGVCAGEAGFFGCLLPGEAAAGRVTDINAVEGLNIYF